MKIVLILIGVAVLIFAIKACMPAGQKPQADTDTTIPSNEHLPTQEKPNDKLVIVDKISKTEIDSILTGFCNMYNKERFQAQPRLYKLSERQFAITFPYDIEFEIYCYFVNYVHYHLTNRQYWLWLCNKRRKTTLTQKKYLTNKF